MLRKVRIEVHANGKTADLIDAETGQALEGVQSYRVEHFPGRSPLVYITSLRLLQGIAAPDDGLQVAAHERRSVER